MLFSELKKYIQAKGVFKFECDFGYYGETIELTFVDEEYVKIKSSVKYSDHYETLCKGNNQYFEAQLSWQSLEKWLSEKLYAKQNTVFKTETPRVIDVKTLLKEIVDEIRWFTSDEDNQLDLDYYYSYYLYLLEKTELTEYGKELVRLTKSKVEDLLYEGDWSHEQKLIILDVEVERMAKLFGGY